jgi:hypothetical protein
MKKHTFANFKSRLKMTKPGAVRPDLEQKTRLFASVCVMRH